MAGSDARFSLHASLVELGGGPLPDEDGSVCGGVGHCRNIVTPAVYCLLVCPVCCEPAAFVHTASPSLRPTHFSPSPTNGAWRACGKQ